MTLRQKMWLANDCRGYYTYALVLKGQNSAVAISHMMSNDFGLKQHLSVDTMQMPIIYFDVGNSSRA